MSLANNNCVLLIEADALHLLSLSKVLQEQNIRYIRNTTGKSAVQQAVALYPQLSAILLSLNLPEQNSNLIFSHLRAHPKTRHIPVIATITEAASPPANDSDFAAVIKKPVNREHLKSVLLPLLQTSSSQATRS